MQKSTALTDFATGKSYREFIEMMETARIAYQRGYTFLYDGIPDFALTLREKFVDDLSRRFGVRFAFSKSEVHHFEKSGEPMPIDLKAYIVARQYDPDKKTFGKIIPELVKHKDKLHPFTRRYLIERMRDAETRHRKLAERHGNIADQFDETASEPQSFTHDQTLRA
jgi:hypothetical protein